MSSRAHTKPGYDASHNLYPDVPLVALCNISETFYPFLQRESDPTQQASLVKGEQYRGDRTLAWLCPEKLVITTFPIPHCPYYNATFDTSMQVLAPETPTPNLSDDVRRETALTDALVDYAGVNKALQIVPYATTPQFFKLVAELRQTHGLTVLTPETPEPNMLWLRDYVDTKTGFRTWAAHWLPNASDILPEGVVCSDADKAAQVVLWFCERGMDCVIKADHGENGIGNIIIRSACESADFIKDQIAANPFFAGGRIVVEQMIPSQTMDSPSLEVFVPVLGRGDPAITYLSNQVFKEFGDFVGVQVSKHLTEQPWYEQLAEAGMRMAQGLQTRGYAGHFDLDAIVGDDGIPYLVEINTRRTGGTHVHEFALAEFGPDYLNEVVLLSNDTLPSGDIREVSTLLDTIGDLAYPMDGARQGIVLMVTSALEAGEFGCISVSDSPDGAIALQQEVIRRVTG